MLANSASVVSSRQGYAFDYSVPGKIMLDITGGAANLIWAGSKWVLVGQFRRHDRLDDDSQLATRITFVTGDNVNFTADERPGPSASTAAWPPARSP